jgi:hypothetical protein
MMVLDGLKKRIEQNDELFLAFCAVMPALDSGDQKFAAEMMNKLIGGDQFLAKQVGEWLKRYRIRTVDEINSYEIFLKATGITIFPNTEVSNSNEDPMKAKTAEEFQRLIQEHNKKRFKSKASKP